VPNPACSGHGFAVRQPRRFQAKKLSPAKSLDKHAVPLTPTLGRWRWKRKSWWVKAGRGGVGCRHRRPRGKAKARKGRRQVGGGAGRAEGKAPFQIKVGAAGKGAFASRRRWRGGRCRRKGQSAWAVKALRPRRPAAEKVSAAVGAEVKSRAKARVETARGFPKPCARATRPPSGRQKGLAKGGGLGSTEGRLQMAAWRFGRRAGVGAKGALGGVSAPGRWSAALGKAAFRGEGALRQRWSAVVAGPGGGKA